MRSLIAVYQSQPDYEPNSLTCRNASSTHAPESQYYYVHIYTTLQPRRCQDAQIMSRYVDELPSCHQRQMHNYLSCASTYNSSPAIRTPVRQASGQWQSNMRRKMCGKGANAVWLRHGGGDGG